ncbi:MAG: hypothetical protein ACPGVU_18330 [Limisphaerales bacterium]
MREYFDKAVNAVKETIESAVLSKPLDMVTASVGKLPYLGVLLVSGPEEEQQYDEKHYFVIPYRASEAGYALHSFRCLPNDVPPINDLPKKRFFHLPHESTEELVKKLLRDQAGDSVDEEKERSGDSMIELADKIDKIDGKVTNGMLLIGGLAAFINPLVGAGIAAQALLPGIAGAVSKFGLRSLGEKVNDMQLNSEIRQAEKEVLKEFEGSETSKIVNPIVRELKVSLNTAPDGHDPLLVFDFETVEFAGEPDRHLRRLSCRALTNQYAPIVGDARLEKIAGLRDKELRWLGLVKEIANL